MAGVSKAASHPNYQSDSTSGFIPEIWSGKLVEKVYASSVFAEIASTDYEGEIKSQGDLVKIRRTADIVIRDYKIGEGLNYEQPTSSMVELNIDQAKYFAFSCNDIIKHQSDLKLMENWSDDAGEQMKVAIDKSVLAGIYGDIAAANQGATAGAVSGGINLGSTGTPLSLDKNNVLDMILDLGLALDEQNLPETGRWLVIPNWVQRLIKSSDLKQAYLTGDSVSPLRNGKIGMIDRFTVYASNNLPVVGTQTMIMAGHKMGLTFATQMTDMETLKNPNDFGNLVRGLNVYGYKVIEGKYLALARAVKA